MARQFFLEAPDPESAFALLRSWAQTCGYQLNGDGSGRNFRKLPSRAEIHLGDLLRPNGISGKYSMRMAEVALVTDEDPGSCFTEGLVVAGSSGRRRLGSKCRSYVTDRSGP